MSRISTSLVVLLVGTVASGCGGGPSHAEWVEGVSAVCAKAHERGKVLEQQVAAAKDEPTRAQLRAQALQEVGRVVGEFEAVAHADDDVLATQWLEVQRDGQRMHTDLMQRTKAPEATEAMTLGLQMMRYYATDEHATKIAGLPEQCGSKEQREEFERQASGPAAQQAYEAMQQAGAAPAA